MTQKKNLRTLLLILLAGLFHRTAWLWFPVFSCCGSAVGVHSLGLQPWLALYAL